LGSLPTGFDLQRGWAPAKNISDASVRAFEWARTSRLWLGSPASKTTSPLASMSCTAGRLSSFIDEESPVCDSVGWSTFIELGGSVCGFVDGSVPKSSSHSGFTVRLADLIWFVCGVAKEVLLFLCRLQGITASMDCSREGVEKAVV